MHIPRAAGISNTLLAVRNAVGYPMQNENPNVALSSLTWGTHMAVSSNMRYQLLNGMDHLLIKSAPVNVFKVVTVIARTGNNVLGGLSFVALAKAVGVQKSAPAADKKK